MLRTGVGLSGDASPYRMEERGAEVGRGVPPSQQVVLRTGVGLSGDASPYRVGERCAPVGRGVPPSRQAVLRTGGSSAGTLRPTGWVELMWLEREILGLRLSTWAWLGVLSVALLTTGARLALPQPDPHRLYFAHTFTTASEREILDAAVAEFEETHPGIRIEQIVSNSETYNTIGWRLQFQGRRQPDIYFHWQGYKVDYCIARGWALDLTPYVSDQFLKQLVPAAVVRQKGGLFFLPQSADISNLVWYNVDLFARLGLKQPRTLDEWRALCARLRREKILPLAQGNRDLWPMGNFAAELLGQSLGREAAGRLFAPGTHIRLRDVQGLSTLVRMREEGCFDLPGVLAPGAVGALGDIDAKVFFLSGKSAQQIVGSWFLADVEDARQKHELAFPVGIFPVPSGAGEEQAMTAVTTGFLVNPATRNPRAAVEFLELLLSRKYQERFARLGNLSLRRDALEFTGDPLARRMLEILADTPVLVPPPDTGYRPEQASVFYEICGKLLTGKLSLGDAARTWDREKTQLARKGL